MKTYTDVDAQIAQWKAEGLSKAETVCRAAEACMGWPYVWGGYGQSCTSKNRKSFAERSSCPAAESAVIVKKCQVLNGSKPDCSGCKWYPGGRTRFFDCRGFTRWLLQQVGISLKGSGATSQWKDDSNWAVKGEKKDLPADAVACVFQQSKGKMQHTGMHIGNGKIIHCSGEVCTGDLSKKSWTHFGIPKGLESINGTVPVMLLESINGTVPVMLRNVLLRKLKRNTWDGTDETVPRYLEAGESLVDNGDGTVTVQASGLPLPAEELLPVPIGVRVV